MKRKGGISQHVSLLLLAVAVQAAISAGMIPFHHLQVSTGLPSLAVIAVSYLIAFSLMSRLSVPKLHYNGQVRLLLPSPSPAIRPSSDSAGFLK